MKSHLVGGLVAGALSCWSPSAAGQSEPLARLRITWFADPGRAVISVRRTVDGAPMGEPFECAQTCELAVPEGTYLAEDRVAGERTVTQSLVVRRPRGARLDVGHPNERKAIVGLTLGGIALALGVAWIVLGAVGPTSREGDGGTYLLIGGTVVAGVGLVGLLIGGLALRPNDRRLTTESLSFGASPLPNGAGGLATLSLRF